MKANVDTNILVRALVEDDPVQTVVAKRVLRETETVIVTVPVLCELVWVLSRLYKIPTPAIGNMIDALLDSGTVSADEQTIQAGLAILVDGGDFADGVIAYDGRNRGADTFLSFDQKAVKLLQARGYAAQAL